MIYLDELGFDYMQFFFFGVEVNFILNFRVIVNFNLVGNVVDNLIDEIFYENIVCDCIGNRSDGNLRLYNVEVDWIGKDFDVRGFYWIGYYYWQYEGDFFGLYLEVNYGFNLDIYNGEILGMEIDGKNEFSGLNVVFGFQLWWGVNLVVLVKYGCEIKYFKVMGVFYEDIDDVFEFVIFIVVLLFKIWRVIFYVEWELGFLDIELGGIWGGLFLNG